jgi:hypothetical protein
MNGKIGHLKGFPHWENPSNGGVSLRMTNFSSPVNTSSLITCSKRLTCDMRSSKFHGGVPPYRFTMHRIAIPSVTSYHPQLPARYVQDYNLGARIDVGAAYNPVELDHAKETATLLRSKYSLSFIALVCPMHRSQ